MPEYLRVMTAPITRREAVDALLMRLSRLHASAVTLQSTAGDIRGDGAPASLLNVLDGIERDLLLATREVQRVRDDCRP